METGRKIYQKNNNIDQSEYIELSIQVSLSGLSFCVLNTATNTFTFYKHVVFKKKLNPSVVLDRIVHYFNTESFLQQNFNTVRVIHDNELSALVPKPLLNEDYLADYLKFNSKILRTDFITYDEILANDSANVYVPYVNINNYLYERFGTFEFKHFSTIIIENILVLEKNAVSTKMYVHVSYNHFEIIVLENNKLKLYNTFDYLTKEDFIYYILFTAEQLQLNPEEFPLVLLGHISKDDGLFNIAYKYIRNVSVLDIPINRKISDTITPDFKRDFILINSF
ncbi:FIG032012: hypothetical protein [hydrothermal vent metagenome]|uniref:DUF3822 domain-containing protein n=1 Tax=hydrothermal vent metagenome TaxID=652676 RepID=A0A3B0QY46_9ZZZZ